MPGFRHPPGADIQRIRQDLRDRYHDGFPILKELLQNADDAGTSQPGHAATRCAFALCGDGLPGARHTLLRGHGMVVINDGGFTADDANSLTSLGLSNKAGQSSAAGKFGLGLKSVFHWAEAFFYFSPHTFVEGPGPQSPGHDLLNPWSSRETMIGRHREWDEEWKETRKCDLQAFSSMVSAMGFSDRWFGLWIPLRRQEHTLDGQGIVQPIENRFPPPFLEQLLGEDWQRRIAETLPLLRRIREVRFYQRSDNAWLTLGLFRVGDGAQRLRFGTEDGLWNLPANNELSGQVEKDGHAAFVVFFGTESLKVAQALNRIRDNSIARSKWPSQFTVGPDGADLQVWEKAEPHGAVIFTMQPAEGQAALRVHQAVFLPLGEPEQIHCAGIWRYNLYLHGFFFVDSGRRGIHPFGQLPYDLTPELVESESQVIQLWNRTLLQELVAPLVIPSLDAFVRQVQMKSDEIELLVCSLLKSELLQKLTKWMCHGQRFILRLKRGGSTWVFEKSLGSGDQVLPWLKIPVPDFPTSELFELLPQLADLCEETTVSFEGKPKLSDSLPVKPSEEELAVMINGVTASAFLNPQHLTYLLKLLPDRTGADSRLATSLVNLANQLLDHHMPGESELRDLWAQFFKRLPTEAFIRLPSDSKDADRELVQALTEDRLPVALLWKDYRSDDGSGKLDWDRLAPLLRMLSQPNLVDQGAVRRRSGTALRLIRACEGLPADWMNQIATWPLFDVRTPSGSCSASNIAELQMAARKRLLFTGGKECAGDLAKAAPNLTPILIDMDLAKALDLPVATCDAAACTAVLPSALRLASDFQSRTRIFDRILAVASPLDDNAWAALRFLLHGEIGAWQQSVVLFDVTEVEPVLVRLLEKALLAAGQPWRRIPTNLVGQLQVNVQQRQRLRLVTASETTIEALIKEVGPANVDCADFNLEDCDFILQRFRDAELLKGLNVHESLNSRRVCVGAHTYVDDGSFTDLPEQFNDLVTRLRDRPGYARFRISEGSNLLVKNLNWEAVIEIALDQPERAKWWDTILTAIGKCEYLPVAVRSRLLKASWLPRHDNPPVAPDDLLHVPGAEAELDRLPGAILAGRIPLFRLHDSFRTHERFDRFKTAILRPAKDALDLLAQLLTHDPSWSAGLSGDWSVEEVDDWVYAVRDVPAQALPVARLVVALHAEPNVCLLLPEFIRRIGGRFPAAIYANVLMHIAQRHRQSEAGNRKRLENVYLRYLREIDTAGAHFACQVLANQGVQLLSKEGKWKSGGQLAPPTEGLSDADVVGEEWANALTTLVASCRQQGDPHSHSRAPDNPETWQAMASEVRSFLDPWRQYLPSPEPIGSFLSLFSFPPPLARLADDYFQSHSKADVHRWIEEHFAGVLAGLQRSFQQTGLIVEVQRSGTTSVRSLLGTTLEARRQENPKNLILGGDPSLTRGSAIVVNGVPQAGPLRRFLRLIPVRPAGYPVPNAIEMFRVAAEQVIAGTIERRIDLTPLFEKLSNASQLEVQVAQSLVVEGAVGLLRQIGGSSHPGIGEALTRWDEARREEASAEALGIRERNCAEEKRRGAQREIRQLLENDVTAQRALLAKVRGKIQQYQYDVSSVLFELWQNADDAVREFEQLGGDATVAKEAGFLLVGMDTEVRIIHFGRLINEFRLPGGPRREDLGFNRDLEKMVVQSISDKADAGARSGAALTGKFGLGFKSVFLVCDAPEVMSGSVDFVIRGGIYPVRLNQAQRTALESTLKAISPEEWRRGTILRLPLQDGGEAGKEKMLSLFGRLAPLLTVFSRRLKRLRFLSNQQLESELRWTPSKLADGIEIGPLALAESNAINALVLSRTACDNRIQFLLGMNEDGFVPLPDDVPVFWVTTPTRTTPGFSFAVNGPFEPDVGRVQLAMQSDKNSRLAADLAGVLATGLKILGQRSSTDWQACNAELKLAGGTSAYDFWHSLWDLLGRRFAEKCRKDDKSPVSLLARRILWESDCDGLQWFYRDCAALPTGLWGDFRVLTRLRDLRHIARGALDRESVFESIGGWKLFQQRVLVGTICSGSHVGWVLERVGVSLREVQTIDLATVCEWELGEKKLVDPELATHLGELITPQFMTGLQNGAPGEREETEHDHLSKVLNEVLFLAADGSWHKSSYLLVFVPQTGVDQDEPRRAMFAPRECQLNPAYTGTGVQFFLASRLRLEAGIEQMAEWILNASDQKTQMAALRYLLDGDMRHDLAERLRPQRSAEIWLWKLDSFDWFKSEFSDDQRLELLAHVLKLWEATLRELTGTGSAGGQRSEQQQPPPKHIWTVEELWKWWELQGKPTNAYTMEGEPNWLLFGSGSLRDESQRKAELRRLLLLPETREGEELWYRLFGYACLVSAGRTTTELRRFWTARLNAKLFWERTIDGDFSQETKDIFEQAVTAEFTDQNAGGEQAYFWRRVFYDIRKIHRMVSINHFPADLMRLVQEGHGQHLPIFLRTGQLPGQKAWVGTFGQSAGSPLFFVIRELVRLKVITDEAVRPLAFFVSTPVRRALRKIGWWDDEDNSVPDFEELHHVSQWLHDRIMKDPKFGAEIGPKLLDYFDIPLLHLGETHCGKKMPVPPR